MYAIRSYYEYSLDEALELLNGTTTAKFDETVEVAMRLGVDPKYPDQQVRGSVVLPNGTGKTVRVLVFAKGEKEKEATEAGADFTGSDALRITSYNVCYTKLLRASGATGANERDAHLVDVVPGRDFRPEAYADMRLAGEGDRCPRCPGSLRVSRGIEVGHVFRLGTKYSKSLSATYLDAGGKEQLIEMGCYGIGVGRTAAAAIEQHHDQDGIRWPISIAPFEVCVLPVNMKIAGLRNEAERVAEERNNFV